MKRFLAVALLAAVLPGCSRGPEPGDFAGYNVLLITIDTLRADRVGWAGYAAADTPVLDGLAADGIVFEEAIATAPVTLPSHASIHTGLYPPRHGALDNGLYQLAEGIPTLATTLSDAGYQTGAVIGAFVLHRQYGLDAGFEFFEDRFRMPHEEGQEHLERRAEVVSALANEWLADRDRDRPFFLWTHYYDPHAPYDPPARYRARFRDPYDGEIAYTDAQVGAILDALRASGDLENTLVVVIADHGEAFGDGGEATHGLLLRGGVLRVPFLAWASGGLPAGRRVQGAVTGADVAPTVLDLTGIAAPDGLDGTSLVPAMATGRAPEDRLVYSETRLPLDQYGWAMLSGVRSHRWARVRAPRPELYDLAADPGELTDLSDAKVDVAARLDARIEAVLANTIESEPKPTLPPEEVEALRSLGYVFGSRPPDRSGADPKDMIPLSNRLNDLRALARKGRHAEAVAGYDEILAKDPGNAEARQQRAESLVRLGRAEEGIADFQKLLDAGLGRGRTGGYFARALARAGRLDESAALLRTLGRLEPEVCDAPFNLGVLMSGQDRLAEAIEAYEEALRRNPHGVHILCNLAEALVDADAGANGDRALELVDRAIGLSRDDDRPQLVKLHVLTRMKRGSEAAAVAEILRKKPVLRGIERAELADAIRSLQDL